MKETIYIFNSGNLGRKDNTILFEQTDGKKTYIPVEDVKEIFAFGEINVNKRFLEFISEKEIILSFFNYYGYYMGSFYPREHYNSGFMILNQAKYYMDERKRLFIAKAFVEGAIKNTLKIIKYYDRHEKDLKQHIETISGLLTELQKQNSIETLMAVEGAAKQIYFNAFTKMIDNKDFNFEARSKKPPKDYINSLISFANSIIYTYVLGDIYKTHLDPRIGFLHSTNFRKFSLNLDVAEIFKPIIGDRAIFAVLNKKIIDKNDFEKNFNGIILKDHAKQKFLRYIEDHLKTTINHSKLKQPVSYRRLIRLELYKLEKHLMEEEEYEPFIIDW